MYNQQAQVSIGTRAQQAQVSSCTRTQRVMSALVFIFIYSDTKTLNVRVSDLISSAKFVKEPSTLYGHTQICSFFVPVLSFDIHCLSLHLTDFKNFQI